ncbi:MAG TPA: orotidine-5'-phosphate decarboxylase [Acidiferrobacteraceae bacterium]|nr:orotidine-5'-phosphate decarboxylase [Acidiferrobacteraceae bacterium]
MADAGPRIVVALDVVSGREAQALAAQLDPGLCRLKVGLELYTACGPSLIEVLQGRGFEIFLDLKFHDIPNTVGRAVRAAAALGVWMLNVHGLGGRRMLEAARAGLDGSGTLKPRPHLMAVTVLTSHAAAELSEVGLPDDPGVLAERLARLVAATGLDGVVCSPHEAQRLRDALGPAFLLITPGIRSAQDRPDDQRRTATVAQALGAGADYVVVGRPITASADPAAALARFVAEARSVLG